MTTETRQRIRAYKKALPELRERVIAVALLLAMSVSMLGSASFAWITLSRSPEISGMQTTVAANGNLEIALAQGSVSETVSPPDESKAGDSSAAEEQTITGANVTWGNLVNVSDPTYGLDKIALRPALLSDYNRNKYPLYGATYGQDGRVVSTSDRYQYASWTITDQGSKYFAAGDQASFGVRAIASVKYSNISGNDAMTEMWEDVDAAYSKAQESYMNMILGVTKVDVNGQVTCIDALEGMVQTFAQEKVDKMYPPSGGFIESDYSGHVFYFYRMMEIFMGILQEEGEALLTLANLQAYIYDATVGTSYFKSLDELLAAHKANSLAGLGVKLDSLTSFANNYNVLKSDLNGEMKTLAQQCDPTLGTTAPKVLWASIQPPVSHFVDISTTVLDKWEIDKLQTASVMDLVGILGHDDKDPAKVIIKEGILADFERRVGDSDNRMSSKNIRVSVTLNIANVEVKGISASSILRKEKVTVPAKVATNAESPFLATQDRSYTSNLDTDSMVGTDAEAKDTYGMAIDLWARTNAPNTVLTLEGKTLFEEVPAFTINIDGETTELYIMTTSNDEFDAYKMQVDGTDVWYYADSHVELSEEELEGAIFVRKMDSIVIGYEGENRVWEQWKQMMEDGLIEEDNITQGSGSCFVFYADPTEQTQILNLLNGFSIAFVDEKGELFGTAKLNTEYAYTINGKVTVPLQMVDGEQYEDEEGKTHTGIMPLKQNTPTRVTAIIYLNGMHIKNQNVLASGEIQGQLNIQFGSSVALSNPIDEELRAQYRTITAEAVSGNQTSSNATSAIKFEYDGTTKKVTVNLKVEGEQPDNISGFFVRSINDTQGTRGDTVVFEPNDDGSWSAVFDLVKPGNYLMRSLMVDGAEYTLDEFPAVEISGMNISSISTNLNSGMHMTADNRLPVEVTAVIDTDPELMPSQVRARFRGENGKEFNALMSYNKENNTWTGTATINVSGTYTLDYLVMDGDFTDIPEGLQRTLIIRLGMTTQVWTTVNPTEFEYLGPVTIPVQAKVRDNGGQEIRALEGVELFYHVSSSALDQNGMHTTLTWNGASGFYEGEMNMTKAGRYSFDRLQITTDSGSSTIRNTTSAPVFVAMPPDPPAYVTYTPEEYQVKLDGSAKLTVRLAYADSATIGAKIVDINNPSASYLVQGMITSNKYAVDINGETVEVYDYEFPIPPNASGNQNGEWKLVQLYFQDIFVNGEQLTSHRDAQGNLLSIPGEVGSGAYYTIDLSQKGGDKGIYAYVVSTMDVRLTKDGKSYSGENFGVNANGNKTGYFMDSYDVANVAVTVQDWNGRAIEGIEGVTWSIAYVANTSEQYGGYSGPNPVPRDVAMTKDESGKTFTAPTQTFQFAGQYTTTVAVVTETGSYTVLSGNNAPAFTVSSLKPYVKFTATNPTNGTPFTGLTNDLSTTTSRTNSITNDGYNVTCYYKSSTTSCTRQTKANPSEVTTTLYEAGTNFSSASCMIDGTGADVTYNYSPSSLSSTREFGSSSGSGNSISLNVVGNQRQAKTLTLVYGGNDYTVTLTTPLTATCEH